MINELLRNIFTDAGLGVHSDHLLMLSKRQLVIVLLWEFPKLLLKLIKNYLIPSSLSLSDINAFNTKLLIQKTIATLKVTRYLIFFIYFYLLIFLSVLFRGVLYSVMCFIRFFHSYRELFRVV